MKSKAQQVAAINKDLIDICGTGGDGSNTFNISTTVSLLLADTLTVAKHGNRSISSKSGSADLIKALDLPIYSSGMQIKEALNNRNYAFLYAPTMHPSMGHVMSIRKQLKNTYYI